MVACEKVFKSPLIQFEDFANLNSFRLLDKYRGRFCMFNDDIQGTAGAGVAGLLGASKLLGIPLKEQKVLFLGAGAAGLGIADLIVNALIHHGVSQQEARKSCWFFDSTGLVVKSRWNELRDEKRPFAHDCPFSADFLEAIKSVRPTCIIGVSVNFLCFLAYGTLLLKFHFFKGQPGTFDEQVIKTMGEINRNPIIFALSNPTSKSECTAEQAYRWTEGRAVFASGSPFDPVTLNGNVYTPGQGNNSYIFPGVGLGVVASRSKHVTDSMFFAAAQALANQVSEEELAQGRIYPALERIREVSKYVAVAVAEVAFAENLARIPPPRSVEQLVSSMIYSPFDPQISPVAKL